jgi:hypothetical protein
MFIHETLAHLVRYTLFALHEFNEALTSLLPVFLALSGVSDYLSRCRRHITHHHLLLLVLSLLLLLLDRDKGLALVVVAVDYHNEDLQEESDNHLTRELVVSQTITRYGHISIHLGVEEDQEKADQELDGRYYRIEIITRLLFLDTREQLLKVSILIKQLLDTELSLFNNIHVQVLSDFVLFS